MTHTKDEAPVQEPVAAKDWEGAEYWMPLAWELCANECGEEACTELVLEGGPIPEPWGDRWLKYEDEAKRLIALVQKHTIPPAAQPAVPEGWQPIETAPMDVAVLLYGAKRLELCVGMHHSRDGWVTDTTSEWASMYPPTHWMPLPAAPEKGQP